jgi:hypothetical protein
MNAPLSGAFSLAQIFFGSFANLFRRRRAARVPGRRLAFEPLENRLLLSADLLPTEPLELRFDAPINGTADSYTLRFNAESGDLELLGGAAVLASHSLAATSAVVINGEDQYDDTLTVDFDFGGFFSVAGGITFNGGADGDDTLIVSGGGFASVEHVYSDSGPGLSGSLIFEQGVEPGLTISYTDLEPLINTGTAAALVFTLTGGDDVAVLEDDDIVGGPNGRSLLRSVTGTFESTTFSSSAALSLTINMGGGNDSLTISSLPEFTGALTVNGGGGTTDTVHFNGAATFSALAVNVAGVINDSPLSELTVTGEARFVGSSVTLGEDGETVNFGQLGFVVADEVNISEDSDMVLGGGNSAGRLRLASAGSIGNLGGMNLAVTNIASFSGSSINLGNQVADLLNVGSLTFNSTGTVSIAEDGDTQLLGSSTAGTLALSTFNALTDASDGRVVVNGDATVSAFSVFIADQSTNTFSVGGRASFDVPLFLTVGANGTTNFGSLTFSTSGQVFLVEDSDTVLTGASAAESAIVVSFGSLTDTAGASLSVRDFVELSAATGITLGDNAADVVNFGLLTVTSLGAVTITEDSPIMLEGANSASSLTLISTGSGNVITDDAGTSVAVSGAARFVANTITLGDNAADTTNFGTLSLEGSANVSEDSDMVLSNVNTSGNATLRSAGSITKVAGNIVQVNGNINMTATSINLAGRFNVGSVTFNSPGAVVITDSGQGMSVTGSNTAGSATLTAGAGGQLTLAGSLDTGTGDVSLSSEGAGVVFSSAATLNVDIGGTDPAAFTNVAVSATTGLTLGGRLDVDLSGGFSPAGGDRFRFMTFPSSTGAFATTDLPANFVLEAHATDLELVFAAPATISIGNATVTEGNTGTSNAVFDVTLSQASTQTITVDFATANGTASAGSDYVAATGTLTFAPGETTKQIVVDVVGDLSPELHETFSVTLSDAVNAVIDGGVGAGQIRNDDTAVIPGSFPLVSEGQAAVFGVRLSHAVDHVVTVDYATQDDTAVAGLDYEAASGTLVFAPGDTAPRQVVVATIDDGVDEATERFLLVVDASGAVGNPPGPLSFASIIDNDPAPTVSIGDVTVQEGNAGTTQALFTVSLSEASGQVVTVGYATADGTALAGSDYAAAMGTITFAPGETTKQIVVDVAGDLHPEAHEIFTVTLSDAANAVIDDGVGTGEIRNDDTYLNIYPGTMLVFEGQAAVFNLVMDHPVDYVVTVDYATQDGTAVAGSNALAGLDYEATSGALVFAPGDTAGQIVVATIDDSVFEGFGFETFRLLIHASDHVGGVLDRVVHIDDNDPAPTISIGDAVVTEGNSGTASAVFDVSLSNASAFGFMVDFATADFLAFAGSDYDALSGILSFAPGETSKQIIVNVAGDLSPELHETFTVTLSNVDSDVIDDGVGVGVIRNDDTAVIPGVSPFASEGQAAVFGVRLSHAVDHVVTVDYATQDDTAVAGLDYEAASGTLVFAPGDTALRQVAVATIDDGVDEATERFLLVVDASGTVGNPPGPFSLASIIDNDPAPTVSIGDATVIEGDAGTTQALFTVSLSEASGRAVTVGYASADGAALAGSDYAAAMGTITFAPGETTKQVVVDVVGDLSPEEHETFTVTLSDAVNAVIDDGVGTGEIRNDDAAVILFADDFVIEGRITIFEVGMFLNHLFPVDYAVTVDYATQDETAVAGLDYEAASGTLTFAPGDTSNRLVVVATIDDGVDEGTESFLLVIESGAAVYYFDPRLPGVRPLLDPFAFPILDNDPAPTISIGNATVTEGNSGTTSAVFDVSLSHASAFEITVDFATADSLAFAGSDYVAATGTLTFAPGEMTKQIVVDVVGDLSPELHETFTVTLSDAVNAVIDDGVGTGMIRNDDTAVIPGVPPFASEGQDAVFGVRLSHAVDHVVTVDYATQDDTALTGLDYEAASGTLVFAPGDTALRQVVVATIDDVVDEGTERFLLVVDASGTVGNPPGPFSFASILDNDPAPTISIGDAVVTEGNGGTTTNAVFEVSLSHASAFEITVDFASADGTGQAGSDYGAASGTLTFAPGETSKQVLVAVNGDLLDEADETFSVTLSNAGNALILDGQGTGTILDDDLAPVVNVGERFVIEGDAGTTTVLVDISLSAQSGQAVSVDYFTTDGTASAGSDYEQASGTVTFAPGELVKQMAVQVKGDVLDEADETFRVVLADAINASIGVQPGLVTILDDDESNQAPVFVEVDDQTVKEGGEVRFIVQANDADDAAGALTFTAGPLPSGASFNAATREFVWRPLDDASASVTFTVSDPDGAQDTMQVALTALNAKPKVEAGPNQVVGLQDIDDDRDDDHDHKKKHGKDDAEAEVSITATFSDLGVRDTHKATIDWGDGTVTKGKVVEPRDGAEGTVKGAHEYERAGVYTVRVTVTDDDGGTKTDTLTITVKKPIEKKNFEAMADEYKLNEDSVLRVSAAQGVLGNDRGPSGIKARVVEGPEHGRLTFNADGSFVYTPERDFHGKDSFWYEFTDGNNVSRAVEVKLNVKDVKDKPQHDHGHGHGHHHGFDWHDGWRDHGLDWSVPFGKQRWR